jgi:hypothetical protein
MSIHGRGKLEPNFAEGALLSRLEQALASLGAGVGANDARNIERQLRTALDSGATRPQLEQAIGTARTVQENAARIHLREAERLLDALAPPVTASENEAESGDGCGCGAGEQNDPRAFGVHAADPAGEKPPIAEPACNDDGTTTNHGTTTNRDTAPAAGRTDSMAELFATAGRGEMTGIAAAMANCQRMFDRACREPAVPAETNDPPSAADAAGSCRREA